MAGEQRPYLLQAANLRVDGLHDFVSVHGASVDLRARRATGTSDSPAAPSPRPGALCEAKATAVLKLVWKEEPVTKEETKIEILAMLRSYGFDEEEDRTFRSKRLPGVAIRLDGYTAAFRYRPENVWMYDLDSHQLRIMLAGVIHLFIWKCRESLSD